MDVIKPLFKVDAVPNVFKKLEDGVYEIFTSLSLKDIVTMAYAGYHVFVVTDKSIYELSGFGVDLEEEKVEKIYAVHFSKTDSWRLYLLKKYPNRTSYLDNFYDDYEDEIY